MDGATLGWVGGVVGAAIGIAGGVVGTRASLKRARTPEERRLVWRFAMGLWLAAAVLAAVLVLMLLGVFPYWAYIVVLCAFFVALGPLIAWMNRRERALGRRPDAGDRAPDGRP